MVWATFFAICRERSGVSMTLLVFSNVHIFDQVRYVRLESAFLLLLVHNDDFQSFGCSFDGKFCRVRVIGPGRAFRWLPSRWLPRPRLCHRGTITDSEEAAVFITQLRFLWYHSSLENASNAAPPKAIIPQPALTQYCIASRSLTRIC